MQIELKLIKWNKDRDLPCINAWHAQWGTLPHPEWYFPEDVYIVPGVCSGAYYKTNSGLAYLENIVSNKDAPHEVRVAGLKLLRDYVMKKAKDDGFKMLIGWTDHPTISQLSADAGAKVSSHKFSTIWIPLVKDPINDALVSDFITAEAEQKIQDKQGKR